MSFTKSISAMLLRYGSDVQITRGDKIIKSKAFVQPLRHQTRVYSDMSVTMGGYKDNRYYLYIGPPNIKFVRGDDAIISCDGKQYVVHTSESYNFCNKQLYVWAVLKPYKTQRQDDYDTD